MHVPFLDLKWQHTKIKDNLKERWDKILENTAFVIGDEVKLFEKNFASYCETKHCVGVSSGTDALILALKALNLPSKSEVICLPTSFIASAEAIVHADLVPRFCEVDEVTGNYDYEKLENILVNDKNGKIKVILAVHLYGRMCDMDKILEIAKQHNLKVVEDAAQAQGATYKGKKAGSFGDVGCFSFYPGKNLGAYGQAGAIVTSNEEIYGKVLRMRDHGALGKYDHDILGYNSKIDNLQAPVLDEKLKHLDSWNQMRQVIAEKYYVGLKDVSQIKFISPNNFNTKSVHHIFAITVPDRDGLMNFLKSRNIGTNIHYPKALHEFSYLQMSGCKKGDFPVAEKLQSETMSLPIFPGQTDGQVQYVVNSVKEFFTGRSENKVESVSASNLDVGKNKLKLGVVGYGYWSPKVINGFLKTNKAEIYSICEKDENKHTEIRKQIPNVKIYLNYEKMMEDELVEAVVVTTTVSSHYRIGKLALEKGKHVLLEKPITEYLWQAEELINLARRRNKVLMVDHTFLFMPAIMKLKEIIASGELGVVHTVTGNRSNLGLLQKDIDVVADLAPHDFSILYYLFNEEPQKIIATDHTPIEHPYQNKKHSVISSTSLYYRSGLFVNFIHSWISPIKDRRMCFIGDKKMAVFDMLDKEGQLKIFDTKINLLHGDKYGPWFSYDQGSYRIVDLGVQEGDDIQRMANEFIDCINESREPRTNGILGKVVVNTLRKVEASKKTLITKYLYNLKNNLIRMGKGNWMLR